MSDRATEIVEILTAAGVGAGAVGGFWAWLSRRPMGQAAVIEAATKLQEALNVAAERQVTGLRGELEALKAEAASHKRRIEELEGELRQATQHSHSLEAVLRRNGIDLSAVGEPGALTIVQDGRATVTRPRRRGKGRKP